MFNFLWLVKVSINLLGTATSRTHLVSCTSVDGALVDSLFWDASCLGDKNWCLLQFTLNRSPTLYTSVDATYKGISFSKASGGHQWKGDIECEGEPSQLCVVSWLRVTRPLTWRGLPPPGPSRSVSCSVHVLFYIFLDKKGELFLNLTLWQLLQ